MKELIERPMDIGDVSDCYDASDALESQAQRIEELKAENAALRNSMQQANTAIAAGDSIIADLRRQLAAVQKNAERYRAIKRWDGAVRDGESAANIRLYGLQGAAEEALLSANSEDLDTAIDAAIAKEKAE